MRDHRLCLKVNGQEISVFYGKLSGVLGIYALPFSLIGEVCEMRALGTALIEVADQVQADQDEQYLDLDSSCGE